MQHIFYIFTCIIVEFFGFIVVNNATSNHKRFAGKFATYCVYIKYCNANSVFGKLFTILQNCAVHIADSKSVNKSLTSSHKTNLFDVILCHFDLHSKVRQNDIACIHTHANSKFFVLFEMSVFAVYWHKEFWFCKSMHNFDFFLTSVSRCVNIGKFVIDNISALFEQRIYYAINALFVSWDWR